MLVGVAEDETVAARRAPVEAGRAQPVAERCYGKRAEDRPGGDVALAHQDRPVLVAVLDGGEPVRDRLLDRPAQGQRVLQAVERRRFLGAVVGRGQGLQALVPEEERSSAPQLVGARARHHVDRGGGGAAGLRAVAVGRDLELLHRVLGHVLQGSAHRVVVVLLPVDRDHPSSSDLARGRHHHAVRLGGIEVRGGDVAGHEEGQLHEVPAVQRQPVDRGLADDAVHGGGSRGDELGRGDRLHRLLHARDLQVHVEAIALADGQGEAWPRERRESLGLGGQGVRPGRQLGQGEGPGGVGGGLAAQGRARLLHRQADSRHGLPLWIEHAALQRGRESEPAQEIAGGYEGRGRQRRAQLAQ